MPVLASGPLGFVWTTLDPFLFCVHHHDAYPKGNPNMGPAAALTGRNIGQDFEGIHGWRMYHGRDIPGFPQHPHRGFETVTIARRGFIDHSDSLGAAARFGQGDVQWMTAGKGIVHSEMFPLLSQEKDNPVELFQIWMNLPARDKMVDPYFSMLWADKIPVVTLEDGSGKKTRVTVVAGAFGEHVPPGPPPNSWASKPESDVMIWSIRMEAGAKFTLPAGKPGSNRMLYIFAGKLSIQGRSFAPTTGIRLQGDLSDELVAMEATELLLLHARPIAEPVVQHGPFVMNSQSGIQQAFYDYQRTRFGGWPWPKDGPVHGREAGRFARRPDGSIERP